MVIEISQHQVDAANKLQNGNILRGGVGSGKTRASILYYLTKILDSKLTKINDTYYLSDPTINYPIVIITTARKRDLQEWELEMAPFRIKMNNEVIVDSWNNIENYIFTKAFFIFDEQRLVGYGTWVKSFLKIAKTNPWILLSATPGDTWSDYIPVFVANGFYKTKSEFIYKHVIYNKYTTYPQIQRYVEEDILREYEKKILVNMEVYRTTKRHYIDICVPFNFDKYKIIENNRWNVNEDIPIKDAAELCRCLREVVNTSPYKTGEVKDIYEKYNKVIIFYNFNYELDILINMCNDLNINYAQWNGKKHQQLPTEDKWIYLVQYTAGAEGWNCVDTNCIIFYSLNYSYKIMEQSAGRIDRINTTYKDLYYYQLITDSSIDKKIKESIKRKEKFNERKFALAKIT